MERRICTDASRFVIICNFVHSLRSRKCLLILCNLSITMHMTDYVHFSDEANHRDINQTLAELTDDPKAVNPLRNEH